jgi:hypothetical protein
MWPQDCGAVGQWPSGCCSPSPASGRGGDAPSPSRGARARGFAIRSRPSNQEGAGNAGRRLAPAVSCAICANKTHTSIQVQPEQPGIPCAMGLRLIPCSPWRRIPLASIAGGLKVLAKPGWISQNLRRLDTSHGCQNHTALPSATSPFVGARPSLTGSLKPALRKPVARPTCRGHRSPHPTSVTIAIRPSCGRGMAGVVGVIWVEREAEYFSRGGLTRFLKIRSDLPVAR